MTEDKYIFTLSLKWLQNEAMKSMGRKLNEEELRKASKGLESALHFDLDTVIETIFEDFEKESII